ncbi:MAG: MSCRAMM family protein, partial [Myxococcota bacterium]
VTVMVASIDREVEVETDRFGQYRVEGLSAGPVTITVDYREEQRSWETRIESGEVTTIIDAQCREPAPPRDTRGSVSGCVCDDGRGAWVEGANVYIVTAGGDPLITGTDTDGCFVLEDVPEGQYVLKVDKGTFYREYDVVITDGQDTTIETPSSCDPPPPPPATGTVRGRVCAPDGSTWLADATVTVSTANGVVETTTDEEGRYTLSGVPAGEDVEVTVTKGSFTSTFVVEVPANGIVDIPEEECALDQDVNIAVVAGLWDNVKSVLLNVGIDPANITDYSSGWAEALLTDYELLSQYDIVFLNCGLDETAFLNNLGTSGIMRDNLRQFVANGGSVYASDQAYDIIEASFPNYIEFYGSDAAPQSAQAGATIDSIIADVVDAGLANALGSSQLELHYPLPAWTVMESVSSAVRVFIRGNAVVNPVPLLPLSETLSNVPHTVSFSSGAGKVVYTSFHQEPGINVQMERVLQLLVFEL